MRYRRYWGLPNEKELDHASRCIRLSGAWLGKLSIWAQATAIPILAGLLLFGR